MYVNLMHPLHQNLFNGYSSMETDSRRSNEISKMKSMLVNNILLLILPIYILLWTMKYSPKANFTTMSLPRVFSLKICLSKSNTKQKRKGLLY